MAKKTDFEKLVKKTDGRIFLYIICFVLAAALGYLGLSMFTKNDEFVVINYGETQKVDCVLNVNDQYIEQGASCISFGKDVSKEVSVKYYYRLDMFSDYVEVSSVDTSVAGIYYACYSSENLKYSNIVLTRTIEVLEIGGIE